MKIFTLTILLIRQFSILYSLKYSTDFKIQKKHSLYTFITKKNLLKAKNAFLQKLEYSYCILCVNF